MHDVGGMKPNAWNRTRGEVSRAITSVSNGGRPCTGASQVFLFREVTRDCASAELERVTGLEPALTAWKAVVLPVTPHPLGAVGGTRTHGLLVGNETFWPSELRLHGVREPGGARQTRSVSAYEADEVTPLQRIGHRRKDRSRTGEYPLCRQVP